MQETRKEDDFFQGEEEPGRGEIWGDCVLCLFVSERRRDFLLGGNKRLFQQMREALKSLSRKQRDASFLCIGFVELMSEKKKIRRGRFFSKHISIYLRGARKTKQWRLT